MAITSFDRANVHPLALGFALYISADLARSLQGQT